MSDEDEQTEWPGGVVAKDQIAERTGDFLRVVHQGLGQRLFTSTIPILGRQDGKTKSAGTGVAIRLADESFLVTAAHVLEIQLKHEIPLFLPESTESAVRLAGDVTTPKDSDRLDVGVVRLPPEQTKALEENLGFEFLRVSDAQFVAPDDVPDGGYVLFGYPNILATPVADTVEPNPMYYGCTPYRESTSGLENFDPSVHMAFRLEKEARDTFSGKVEQVPEFYGMSGCSIWRAYGREQILCGWKPADAALIGIQSSIYSNADVLKTVSWGVAEQLIRTRWPHLQSVLNLVPTRSSLVKLLTETGFVERSLRPPRGARIER